MKGSKRPAIAALKQDDKGPRENSVTASTLQSWAITSRCTQTARHSVQVATGVGSQGGMHHSLQGGGSDPAVEFKLANIMHWVFSKHLLFDSNMSAALTQIDCCSQR